MMAENELNITRGLLARLVAGSVAFAVPWLLLCVLLSVKWLGNDMFRHWRDLVKEHGELAGFSGPMFVLTLPDGEPFGDFWIRWYPTKVTETWEQFIPRVQECAQLLYAYADATGRRSGEIENRADFVCDDGQRIPIAQCAYRRLLTDADYAQKVKRKKKE